MSEAAVLPCRPANVPIEIVTLPLAEIPLPLKDGATDGCTDLVCDLRSE